MELMQGHYFPTTSNATSVDISKSPSAPFQETAFLEAAFQEDCSRKERTGKILCARTIVGMTWDESHII